MAVAIVQTITGQIRCRRKANKNIFFIDVQPLPAGEKSQIFFRTDDQTLDYLQFQEEYHNCKPGSIVEVQVGYPLNPKEAEDRPYAVWQTDRPIKIITPYTEREGFRQDPPLGSLLKKMKEDATELTGANNSTANGPSIHKSNVACKYWINKNICHKGKDCKFQHPVGEDFVKARKEWLEERERARKQATFDPEDPHTSKKPHGMRALIFVDWLLKNFQLTDKDHVLDVAGGKGEISMFLSRGFGIPATVVDPKVRKTPPYWLTRLRRHMYRFESGNDLEQPDWKSREIHFDAQKWPYTIQPTYLHTLLDDPFVENHKELMSETTLLVGLHADQATVPIVDIALKYNKSFAVVPCCVFNNCGDRYFLRSGELVATTDQQIQYLCEKNKNIKVAYLDFEGKNKVVYNIVD
ncbi:hypothetical protein BDF20DRAFT_834824 [Mycotypha africana]|uniref:uncharacterized protein n=1 Tax=Mycotypha africana TaxID=64632 RepID=UPI002300FB49|nr:uncharacterized protein BDF20DRAFT_834824 [Mycotypha africana]KAI8982180.1 hypothetical protein BDF20DRAFT_834824 [Mycotypha africana]